MSNDVTNLCRALAMSPAQKAVLVCLADYANHEGEAWPSVAAICSWTCLSRSAVIDARNFLEKAGYFSTVRETGKNTRIVFDLARLASLNQSASRTSPDAGPVREPDYYPSASRTTPVRELDGTRPGAGRDPSGSRTQYTIHTNNHY
ncbi:MAG: helix-turn-helix domain-containing protein [Rhodoferax sp.]|nr:helix-turn-helix domain-containing protein [Rhodoferax sp.]